MPKYLRRNTCTTNKTTSLLARRRRIVEKGAPDVGKLKPYWLERLPGFLTSGIKQAERSVLEGWWWKVAREGGFYENDAGCTSFSSAARQATPYDKLPLNAVKIRFNNVRWNTHNRNTPSSSYSSATSLHSLYLSLCLSRTVSAMFQKVERRLQDKSIPLALSFSLSNYTTILFIQRPPTPPALMIINGPMQGKQINIHS